MTEQKIVEMWRAYYGEGDKKAWRVVDLIKEGRILSTRMFHKKKHAIIHNPFSFYQSNIRFQGQGELFCSFIKLLTEK